MSKTNFNQVISPGHPMGQSFARYSTVFFSVNKFLKHIVGDKKKKLLPELHKKYRYVFRLTYCQNDNFFVDLDIRKYNMSTGTRISCEVQMNFFLSPTVDFKNLFTDKNSRVSCKLCPIGCPGDIT